MKQNKLHNIKNTGFKTPNAYFKGLENQILNQVKLSEIDNSGFKMPKDYLDTVENRVISSLSLKEETKVISLFSKRNIIYISSIAAAILLVFNLSVFEKDVWDLEAETVENYIIDEAISTYEIAALLDDEDLIEDNFINHSFSDEIIENYVLDNIDIEELILE